MKGEYRFLRAHHGRMGFAKVVLRASSAKAWSIEFGRSADKAVAVHGDSLREGIMLAAHEYEKLGGACHRVEVESLVDSVADTSPDVVRCAAAVAAWKALGRNESEVVVVHGRHGWEVSFVPALGGESE